MIYFVISGEKTENYTITTIKVSDLKQNEIKDEIYTTSYKSFLNVKYHLKLSQNNLDNNNNKNMTKNITSSPLNTNEPKNKSKLNSFLSFFRTSQKMLTPKPLNRDNLNLNVIPLKINENRKVPIIDKNNLASSNPNLKIENQNYEIIESKIPYNNNSLTDNFVIGIFTSGLDNNKLEYIENSCLLEAPCHHEECSILSSLKPSILSYYINKDNEFIINDPFAFLSFPFGIKLCYKCKKINNKFEDTPFNYPPFITLITNNIGRFYMVTLHYYRIISKEDFQRKFSINPINEYMKNNNEINSKLAGSTISKNFNSLNEIILYEKICIPESVSLISKFPYFSQMADCLKNILSISKEKTKNLIENILNEILVPPPNSFLEFYLPHSSKPIKLLSPYNQNNEILTNINLSILFKYFSPERIIEIFKIILLEQKIIFISNDLNLLTEIIFIFISLLYPLKWEETCIFNLNIDTIGALQSPSPFIVGINEPILNLSIEKNFYSMDNDEISLIYIDNIKAKNKTKIKTNIDMPSRINDFMINELKVIKKILNNSELNYNIINEKIQLIFLKVMILFIGEYKKYVYYNENNDRSYFDKIGLVSNFKIDNKESKTSKIVERIISTQNFNQFFEEEKKNYYLNEGFNKEIESYEIELVPVIQKNLSKTSSLNKVISRRSLSKAKEKKDNIRRLSSLKENNTNNNTNSNNNDSLINENIHNTSFLSNNNLSRDSLNFNIMKKESLSLLSGVNPFKKLYNENKSVKRTPKHYLLFPYFFKNKLLLSNLEKKYIEDYINGFLVKNKLHDISLNEQHCFILPFDNKKMNLNDIKNNKSKYIIPQYDFLENNISELKENEVVDLSYEDKKIMQNLFLDIFIKKNQQIEDFDKKINKYFLITKLKKYFLNFVLFKIRIHPENLNKLIGEIEFNYLFKIIKYIFQFPSSEKDYFIEKGYTIVSFLYYKYINHNRKEKKEFFIYEEILKKEIYCDSWRKRDFWEFFIDDEISKDKDFQYLFCLKKVHYIMNKLKLSHYFQKEVLISDFIRNMVGEDIYEQFVLFFDGNEEIENLGFYI